MGELVKTQWEPISTAPLDGTRILVAVASPPAHFGVNGWLVTVAQWHDAYGDPHGVYASDSTPAGFYERYLLFPSHWMPLPEPPPT